MFTREVIPKSFDVGTHKGSIIIYDGAIVAGGIEFVVKLY